MSPPVMTIAEAAHALHDRTLSPLALAEACLSRIAAHDGRLHAFITVTAASARASARRAEAEIAAGQWRGALHGIPLGIKDIYATAGIRTTAHSRLLLDHVPTEDAVVVARLKAAGAIILGKLATHEFAFGGPSSDLPFPPARNPWDLARVPGGSSSGSGAAVAAGLCLGATGSDTGGSIRDPAGFCGLAGLKPSFGRVSRRGVLPLSHTLDTCGPMAWTSEDCALLLQAMAGHDAQDPASVDAGVPDYRAALDGTARGLRIGVVRHFYAGEGGATAEVIEAIDAALAVMRDLGAHIEEVTLPDLADFHACGRAILLAEAYAIHRPSLEARPEAYGQWVRERLRLGAFITAEDYVAAQRLRRRLVERTLRAMEHVDLLVTANQFGGPLRFTELKIFPPITRPFVSMPFNLTGQPALALCCGFDREGLPLSLQIAGRAFDEAGVLRLGDAYERATPWRGRRPPL